jgi:molybdopterin-binding protein
MPASYRPGEVAELLGVSVDTVRRWCDEGRLATTRSAGGHRLIAGSDLARYLAEQAPAYEPGSLPAIVEVRAGPHRVVSLMTAEALDELALEPGDLAVAVVKATTVMVEVPTSP